MKLGVSHQRPQDLNQARFDFLSSLGVEAIEVRIDSRDATRETLEEIVAIVAKSDLDLHEIMLEDLYNSTSAALNRPTRDEDLETLKTFIRNLGDLGICHTTYAWHTGGVYETHRDQTRGVATRGFSSKLAAAAEQEFERVYDADELWENYERFIGDVLPVAENA